MPYNGPSKGCGRCLFKKVKCDENKPTCLRCRKAGQACEYKDRFDSVLRNQNHHVEQTVKAKWRQRTTRPPPKPSPSPPKSTSVSPTSTESASSRELTRARARAPIIPTPVSLRPSFQQMVHLRFFYDFANAQSYGMTRGGALGRIPKMMAACSPDSWFHSAMSALSFANFGGRLKSQEAKDAGVVFYYNALGRLARAMSRSGGARIATEEALPGIFLLGIYEVMTSSLFDGTYATHQRGAASILKFLRDGSAGRNRFGQARYTSVIYVQVLMSCLSNKEPLPAFLADMELHAKDDPRSELAALVCSACKIRHRFAQFELQQQSSLFDVTNPEGKNEGPDQLLREAMDLDTAMEEWYQRTASRDGWNVTHTAPLNAQSRPQWARELFSLPGAPKQMLIYHSLLAALFTELYRGTRLLLNLSILEGARRNVDSPLLDAHTLVYNESIAESTTALLMELITDLCMGVPSMLQLTATGGMDDPQSVEELYSFRGLLMLWPLVAAIQCLRNKDVQKCDNDCKRAWVQCLFAFLKNSMSLAKAQAFITEYGEGISSGISQRAV